MLTTQTVVKPVSFKGRTFEVQYDEMRNGSSSWYHAMPMTRRHLSITIMSLDDGTWMSFVSETIAHVAWKSKPCKTPQKALMAAARELW